LFSGRRRGSLDQAVRCEISGGAFNLRMDPANLVIAALDGRGSRTIRRGGFTLVELLVTISVIASLLAILLPAVAHAMRSARSFRCKVALRSAAFDFSIFADEQLHGDRGNDEKDLENNRFRLETFQDSQYGLQEFWRWDALLQHTIPDAGGFDPLRCAEVKGAVTLVKDNPCSSGGVTPARNVSYTFNSRLHRAEVVKANGKLGAASVLLNSSIMEQGMVPLAWDVDGATAAEHEVSPVFSAPALDSKVVYAGDLYWFPAFRHGGSANFALIDGSVLSSAHPLDEPSWNWAFQPMK
jgi:prepilin-type N-terminal cleavage/methylation domain-containing protein/prepilin-type processing-associated H-X9-DG protein